MTDQEKLAAENATISAMADEIEAEIRVHTESGIWKAWAALNEEGTPIANSIRRTRDECCHDSSVSDPVEIIIQILSRKPEWKWVMK